MADIRLTQSAIVAAVGRAASGVQITQAAIITAAVNPNPAGAGELDVLYPQIRHGLSLSAADFAKLDQLLPRPEGYPE